MTNETAEQALTRIERKCGLDYIRYAARRADKPRVQIEKGAGASFDTDEVLAWLVVREAKIAAEAEERSARRLRIPAVISFPDRVVSSLADSCATLRQMLLRR